MSKDINYPKLEKLLVKYVFSLSEESKLAFFERYRASGLNSYYAFIENYLYDLGVISINIDFINESQCYSYVKFEIENAWSIERGFVNVSEHTVTFQKAQELLADYLIKLLNLSPIAK